MTTPTLAETDSFRYERKFILEGFSPADTHQIIKNHPAVFNEIFALRRINSIYLDTLDFANYSENLDGLARRIKVRIRWYGPMIGRIDSPRLELKLKHNIHVGKLTYPLSSFTLDENFSSETVVSLISAADMPAIYKLKLRKLAAQALISYERRYYLSLDKKFRLTVDSNMEAYRIFPQKNRFLYRNPPDQCIVMELKYNKDWDHDAETVCAHFPFRTSRNSKYVNGVRSLFV